MYHVDGFFKGDDRKNTNKYKYLYFILIII